MQNKRNMAITLVIILMISLSYYLGLKKGHLKANLKPLYTDVEISRFNLRMLTSFSLFENRTMDAFMICVLYEQKQSLEGNANVLKQEKYSGLHEFKALLADTEKLILEVDNYLSNKNIDFVNYCK